MDLWSLVYVAVALLAVVIIYMIYSGLLYFPEAKVVSYPFPTMTLAYKFRQQSYGNCVELFKELGSLAPGHKCAGLYYDDPRKVPEEKQRFVVGCIVAEGEATPDPNFVHSLKSNGYKLMDLPVAKAAVMTSFPFKNYLSIILSNRRVWTVLENYLLKYNMYSSPWIEVHGGPDMLYVVPMDNQESFFAPEVQEAAPAE